jgi:23S rRNA (pseudouridine1915-N3)-methyltransferase
MKINCVFTGKTNSPEIKKLTDEYLKRINRYLKAEEVIIDNAAIKTTVLQNVREKEGELLLRKLSPSDFVILLDDKGKEFTSVQLARHVEMLLNQSHRQIWFVVGGAYGFSPAVYERANAKISLSKLTFSHQIIRPVFLEQLYRAFTILHNESYHHE